VSLATAQLAPPGEHRAIDWAARSSFTGEFEVAIMIKVVTEEMHRSY
jgi:hypothetical protein